MIEHDAMPYQPVVRRPLPGKAVGAAIVALAYGALSVIGIFQILAIRDQLRSSERSVVTIAVVIAVLVIALLFIGAAMVLRDRTRVPLLVGAAISLLLAVFGMQQGFTVFTLLNLGASIAMVLLLNSAEVKEHFRR